MTGLGDLETPALLLDRVRAETNVSRMHARLAARGVPLRPHVKTAKNIELARMMVAEQPGGITVSTLQEADLFAEAGFTDILYAVGIAPSKIAHAARLIRTGVDLKLILDSIESARILAGRAVGEAVRLPLLIEIDCDGHRSGLKSDSPDLLALGRFIDGEANLTLAGVMTHAGGSYESRSHAEIAAAAEAERTALAAAAERLRAAELPCPIVSAGSTPTALFGSRFDGLTEVRAGVFIFNDLMMVDLGVAAIEDIAISVLVSVIGHRPEHGWAITDGGWTALSFDRGSGRYGYGLAADAAGAPIDGVIVRAMNQEHGILARADGGPLDPNDFPIGRLLRILPNHACATASNFGRYAVLERGMIAGFWPRLSGQV